MGSVTAGGRGPRIRSRCARILFGADFVDAQLRHPRQRQHQLAAGLGRTMTSRVIRTYARANQAAVFVPFILGGAMGPVTNGRRDGAIASPRP